MYSGCWRFRICLFSPDPPLTSRLLHPSSYLLTFSAWTFHKHLNLTCSNSKCCFLFFNLLIGLRKRDLQRERERTVNSLIPLIYTFIGWFLYGPWPGIKPATLEYPDDVLTNWPIPAGHQTLLISAPPPSTPRLPQHGNGNTKHPETWGHPGSSSISPSL